MSARQQRIQCKPIRRRSEADSSGQSSIEIPAGSVAVLTAAERMLARLDEVLG